MPATLLPVSEEADQPFTPSPFSRLEPKMNKPCMHVVTISIG